MNDQNSNTNSYIPSFFIVPFHIMSLPGITLGFAKVYDCIFQFWNKGRQCFLSDKVLMERTNLAKSQLYEAFAFFEKHGELKRRTINFKRYLVQPEKIIELESSKPISNEIVPSTLSVPANQDLGSGGAEGGGPVERKGGSGGAEHNIKNLNKEKDLRSIVDLEQSTTNKKSVLKEKDYEKDARFMSFYSIYPRQVQPWDAWKAFKNKIGNNDELLNTLLTDLKLRKEKHSQWGDKQFIKLPAGYIRSGEFLGEIYNAETELKEKKERERLDNEKRQAEQERLSQLRADTERQNDESKYKDGKIYRQLKKESQKIPVAATDRFKNLVKEITLL